jgi:Formyl transferase
MSRFARQCVEHVLRDGLAELKLVIIDSSVPTVSTLGEKLKKAALFQGALWYLQDRFFPADQTPSWREEEYDSWLPTAKRIVCEPVQKGKWSQYFQPEDIAAIQAENLDFILKFGFRIIRGDVLKAARLGIWSYHHADEEKYRGGPPAFWEIALGDPVTGALLQRLNERLDGGIVLKKALVPTDGGSYRANLDRVLAASTHMARWVCLDVLAGAAAYLEPTAAPSKTTAPIYRAPDDAQTLKFWGRLALNYIKTRVVYQRVDEWNVGLIQAPLTAFADPAFQFQPDWSGYSEPQQMIADPFLVPGANPPRILVEEYSWHTGVGRISELRGETGSANASNYNTITPLIDEGIHMSYPFPVEHEGALYVFPECSASRSVRCYKLDAATGTWNRQGTLLDDVDAADATLFHDGSRWWMFYSGTEGHAKWSLYVWSAPDLIGPWTPHPGNPVKTDVSSSRPGGNMFWHEGHIYRPAQDASRCYGGALALNRIDVLDDLRFEETVVRRFEPDPSWPYPDGLHTLSGTGDWCVIDAKKHTWPLAFLLKRKLGWMKLEFEYTKGRLTRPDKH